VVIATASQPDGRSVIVLGLTRGNVDRLTAGQPVHIGADSHPGFPAGLVVTIFFGETERDLTDALRSLIGPETKIVGVPKEGNGRPN
jgi:hypothetical protein